MTRRNTIIICYITIVACLLIACGGGDEDVFENIKAPCVYIPEIDSCGPSNENLKGENV